jgi:Plasmid encoded RepA protein
MTKQPGNRDIAEIVESIGRTLKVRAKKEAATQEPSQTAANDVLRSARSTVLQSGKGRGIADKTDYKPLTRAQSKLLDAGDLIYGEPATTKDAAFIARELVQATLPHKNPGDVPVWQRRNGNLTLVIQPGWNPDKQKSYGFPYGSIPRLLVYWMTTEATRTKSRRLELGPTLSGFMVGLGLIPSSAGAGKRSDAKRLRDQMERLFQGKFSFHKHQQDNNREGHAWLNMEIAPEGELWWSMKDPQQTALWGSWIELGQRFYEAITASPVPVDMRALKALKRSPLALDLYSWLTYEAFRAHKSGKPRYETWAQLHAHIGSEYGRLDNFRSKAKAALRKIKVVYPGLKLGKKQGGIEILPQSYPALQARQVTIEGRGKTL